MKQCLVRDGWLSRALGKAAYRLDIDGCDGSLPDLGSEASLIYTKISTLNAELLNHLCRCGFVVVDTALTFEKALAPPVSGVCGDHVARMAEPKDEAQVRTIAAESFSYSRFHLDPLISRETAAKIKQDWAGNYFNGQRGDHMVVVEKRDSGEILGFLQLLTPNSELVVIDLVAVAEKARGKGLASLMIHFAERELKSYARIRVGTQAANIASVRLYEGLGFKLVSSAYVLHLHRERLDGNERVKP